MEHYEIMEIKYKQFIVINKSLGMGLGKSCAMTAHSSYLALREQDKTNKTLINKWLKNGECVIVLEAHTSTQMFGLQQYLNRKKITNHLYIDEGLTEVEMGEPTVLATGVLTEEESEWLSTMELYSDNTKIEIIEKQRIRHFDENSYLNYFNQPKKIYPIFENSEDEWDDETMQYRTIQKSIKLNEKQNDIKYVNTMDGKKIEFTFGKEPRFVS